MTTGKQIDAASLLEGTTAGPWLITDDASHPHNSRIGAQKRLHIAKVYAESMDPDLVADANARLIASAPDLAREVIALRARVEVLEKALLALEAARQFIMSKYRDPADEVNGEWMAKEAREF